ncbi:hippocampus abundant transcript-like protein 1-like [Dorcoceras hygrometricum]|uniref:Hippocampus abundant transcript-like protein 1-like n=1 Tax=Dorcoceras hygrometricum TaxID=472368 RepID=A0A2Z7ALX6_9LAMI|nr:hippocampus abundant transcript-like protein 1-like [Dorcoceras hygrometricum]
MEKVCRGGLSHLFMTVFLYCFANFMVVPAITDVTMAALCPGKDECSLAIYLTGAQQAKKDLSLGHMWTHEIVKCNIKKHCLGVGFSLPNTKVILAYRRTQYYFYAYYLLKTVIAMATEGSVHFLALAYVADNVPERKRASVFGIISGFASSSFVFGNLSARFLSTSATFQVAAAMSVIALVYMRLFLRESFGNNEVCVKTSTETDCLLEKAPAKQSKLFKNLPSLDDAICLLKTSPTFSKAAVVAFFINVADVGLYASLMYYLKAQFHFNKDQFADLMIIAGIAGAISQLIIMPLLTPFMGEEKMLSIGLFFSFAHMILYSVAWAPWVPYAAALISVVATFALPCLRSIASKQTGPNEQGKAQGCITGICSFASIVSPIVFSPLTALFLSDNAPFYFPGFSIMCSGFAAMIAFIQSTRIKPPPAATYCSIGTSNPAETIV